MADKEEKPAVEEEKKEIVDKVSVISPIPTIKEANEFLRKNPIKISDDTMSMFVGTVQNTEDIKTLDKALTSFSQRLEILEKKVDAVSFLQVKLTPWWVKLFAKYASGYFKTN